MFDGLLAGPAAGWVFGWLYLPGGSANLGAEGYGMAGGSQAPLVGTLMEVTRAVRLMDGKLLILATAVGRFKVRCAEGGGCLGGRARVGGRRGGGGGGCEHLIRLISNPPRKHPETHG